MKRKPSRRSNTRATRNVVERQRRETLNGRFLDFSALLPNLSQIRCPSKSSIVNSSIAHVHASRRHRLLAARELRQLKLEADALRRELNEWRDRAQIPRVEEPVRSDGFSMVLLAELEVIAAVPGDGDDEDGYDGEGGNDGGYGGAYMDDIEEEQYAVPSQQQLQEMEDPRVAAMLKNANPFAQSVPSPVTATGLAHLLPRPSMVGPYDNSLALYEQQAHHAQHQQQAQHPSYPNQSQFLQDHQEKLHWNNMYPSQHQQHVMHHPQQQLIQAQRSLYTPPAHDHGLPSPPRSSGSGSVSPPHHSSASSTAFAGDATAWTSQPVSRRSSGSSGTGSGYTGSYGGSPVYAESPTGYDGSPTGQGYTSSPTGYAGSSSGYGGSYTGSPPGGDSPAYELALGQADYGVPRRGGYPVEMGVGMQQQQAVVGGMMM